MKAQTLSKPEDAYNFLGCGVPFSLRLPGGSTQRSTMRPRYAPSPGVPFGVRSVGFDELGDEFAAPVLATDNVQFFWCVEGRGTVWIDDLEYPLCAGDIAIFMTNQSQRRRGSPLGTCEWRWSVDGPLAEAVCHGLGLSAGVFAAGEVPRDRLEGLMKMILLPGRVAELQAAAVGYELLSLVAVRLAGKGRKDAVEEARQIIADHWSDASFSVDALADAVGVHRSTLFRRFRAIEGQTPGEYLRQLRVRYAENLLATGAVSATEAAGRSGFGTVRRLRRALRAVR